MNPLSLGNYLKAVIGAVGANVFPPLADWVTSYLTSAPPNVRSALSILLVSLATGGAVYSTPNKMPPDKPI